uniref:Uncharacterized protein n=1 Tax=Alexandrium monilatum TaxID=311494 RepID=A0A7S4QI28_9DINO|mmetsp:Transcript_57938/g.172333  ORF Transcript_57938/g.172333 Transcript_57938/m.172333 type:complete len:586 (+) Transcript_57938:92-1849(+)
MAVPGVRATAALVSMMYAGAFLPQVAGLSAPGRLLLHEEAEDEAMSMVQLGAALQTHADALGESSSLLSRGSTVRQQRSRKLLMWVLGHHRDGLAGDRREEAGTTDPPAYNATCNGSGYFIDWGSSGMKVYRVHRRRAPDGSSTGELPLEDLVKGSFEDYKLSGVNAESSPAAVQAILDGLLQHLPGGATAAADGPDGAALATAGMRLEPERADRLWASVQTWSQAHPGFFGRCGHGTDDADCRTLAGAEEAAYELRSALRSRLGVELEQGGRPFGFASAGGASLQVGVRGPEAELHRCRRDLGALDTHFDPWRADVAQVNGVPTLLVSFLSVTDLRNRTCEGAGRARECDYDVGGLDQMRARFDEFLLEQGNDTNPCLSPYARRRPDEKCSIFDSASCVLDRFGGKISGLEPTDGSLAAADRRAECRRLVSGFIHQDLVLGRWSSSPACLGLAGNASRWALLSSFARETQLGADVGHGWEAFGDVLQAATRLDFATKEAAERGEEGVFLSSALLVDFLDVLGLSPTAELRGMSAEWADEAMRDRGLVRGWALPGRCPGESGSASAPRCWAAAFAAMLSWFFLAG